MGCFGNVEAVYQNSPEAKERRDKGTFVEAPFLPDAKLFETPERPDLIGAGDFDAAPTPRPQRRSPPPSAARAGVRRR